MGQGESTARLTPSELEELRRNTKFSMKELTQFYEEFLTEFPDGNIRKEQFVQLYQRMMPHGNAKAFAENIFRAYDQDGNGLVDFQEFMRTMSVTSKGTISEKLEWAFQMYDKDGDGYITMEESIDILESIFEMKGVPDARKKAEDSSHEIFLTVDKNMDGQLSRDEFCKGAKNCNLLLAVINQF